MSDRDQTASQPVASRPTGPQGTRLFSVDELRQNASATEPKSDGRASVREPVLEGVSAGVEGVRFTLHSGRQTIGRSASSDVVIEDPGVSSSHAWIVNHHGQHAIMNTLSTNGTFVNGKRIHEAMLKHNDHIRFGQSEFVFLTREHGAVSSTRSYWILAGLMVFIGLAALTWWFN